jgi:hypothetical protein
MTLRLGGGDPRGDPRAPGGGRPAGPAEDDPDADLGDEDPGRDDGGDPGDHPDPGADG